MNVEPVITPVGEKEGYFEKNKKMIIVLIVMLLVFCGLATYIFISGRPGENKAANAVNNNTSNDDTVVSSPVVTTPTPTPAPTPTPTPISTYNPTLPAGWTLNSVVGCNVDLVLPPASGIYYKESETTYSKWIFQMLVPSASTQPFQTGAIERLGSFSKENGSELGSDNPANSFNITCEQGELTNDEVVAKFGSNASISYGGTEERWGVTAQVIIFHSEHFGDSTQYLIRKNGMTYLTSYHNGTIGSPEYNAAEQISNNIMFK